jgi:hypothetical protein
MCAGGVRSPGPLALVIVGATSYRVIASRGPRWTLLSSLGSSRYFGNSSTPYCHVVLATIGAANVDHVNQSLSVYEACSSKAFGRLVCFRGSIASCTTRNGKVTPPSETHTTRLDAGATQSSVSGPGFRSRVLAMLGRC